MSTGEPTSHVTWGDETHVDGFYSHTAVTPDFTLTVTWPDQDHRTPANENIHWTLASNDGTLTVSGDEPQSFMAFDAVLKAFARRRPATYAVRTWITATLNDPEGPTPVPGGPRLDDVTLDDAHRAAEAFTGDRSNFYGVTCWIYDMQGKPFTTYEQGVPASF